MRQCSHTFCDVEHMELITPPLPSTTCGNAMHGHQTQPGGSEEREPFHTRSFFLAHLLGSEAVVPSTPVWWGLACERNCNKMCSSNPPNQYTESNSVAQAALCSPRGGTPVVGHFSHASRLGSKTSTFDVKSLTA